MQAPNRSFDGRLSELSIFDDALSPAQIQDLYSNVRQNFENITTSVLPPKACLRANIAEISSHL